MELSSKPGTDSASFEVIFRGNEDGDTTVTISSCIIESNGEQIDALTGESVSSEQNSSDSEEESEEDEGKASFVIDNRTFYVRRPDDVEGFTVQHMTIQGYDCRVLKSDTLDLYVVRLRSDNGTYRDDFVYNPENDSVIPFVQMQSGNDTVIFIEPDENEVPNRYTYVDLGWGPKYTIPAYKHYNLDGVDEIQDDSNRYLVYGINQDGELETKEDGLREELTWQAQRYNQDMGRRLVIILVLTLLVIVFGNVAVFQHMRMKKMQLVDPEEDADDEELSGKENETGSLIVGNLEENETDFTDPGEEDDDLEIIDLDDTDDEE